MGNDANDKPGCLAALFTLFRRNAPPEAADQLAGADEPLPYRLRDDFLSPAELSFYHVLNSMLRGRAVVCAKVGLAELFFVARPHENFSHFNRIVQKHVDFVLCEPVTLQPLVAIELDDASHQRGDRRQRDLFVDEVFAAAALPLLHVPAQRQYAPAELEALIVPHLPDSGSDDAGQAVRAPAVEVAPPADEARPGAPACPKCGVPMVLRTARQGARQGEHFYGCPNYPRCRELLPALREASL